jgi:CheY-like chemotaxis protein
MVAELSKEIFQAESGIEAVTIFKRNPDIDVVFLDFHMPKMNGLEAANQIRSINKDVVIILVTADTYTDAQEDFKQYGINDLYFKPYNRNFLKELIIKHFYRKT